MTFNFQTRSTNIKKEANKYGVTVAINVHSGALFFVSSYRGTSEVEKTLTKKIDAYNTHVLKGF